MLSDDLTKTYDEVATIKPKDKTKGASRVVTATEFIYIAYKSYDEIHRQHMSIKRDRLFYHEDIVYGAIVDGLFYYVEPRKSCI